MRLCTSMLLLLRAPEGFKACPGEGPCRAYDMGSHGDTVVCFEPAWCTGSTLVACLAFGVTGTLAM